MSDTDMPERTYYAQIPNLIDDAGLSVYAFRLLAHIRRIAGDTGECWEGTRTLAEKCGMSVGQVSNAKAELVKRGFISITRRPIRGGFVDELRPVDVWTENEVKYRSVHTVNTNTPSVQDTNTNPLESVHLVNTNGLSVHTVNAGVHLVNESITIDQEQDHSDGAPAVSPPAPKKKRALKSVEKTQTELLNTPLAIYRRITNMRSPNQAQRELIETVTDLDVWEATCELWALNGYDARKVPNIIDRYHKNLKDKQRQSGAASYQNGAHAEPFDYDSLPNPYEENERRKAVRRAGAK
jgi:DNA-binding transcriptional MocR family regulator